jgi:hypothetical protein
MRLGGSQSRTFMAGVRGVTAGASALPVVIDAAGQLGTAPNSAVSLGPNTFTGTQTIQAGHLDLDAATANTGVIRKNGTWFLHDYGIENTYLGFGAGNFGCCGLGLTGAGNTGIGFLALRSLTAVGIPNLGTASGNTAVGNRALTAVQDGGDNTAVGVRALAGNVYGNENVAVGANALGSKVAALNNVAIGVNALANGNFVERNVALGYASLANSVGYGNIAVGSQAGVLNTTGSNNIYVGSVFGGGTESNTMYLGAAGLQNRTFVTGIRGVTTGAADAVPVVIDSNGQLGTVSSSIRFKEDIRDMADMSRRLLQLRPVTFRYTQAYGDGSKPIQYGLVAEEVAETFPELAVRDANGNVETVHYETLNVLLLNELKKQHDRIEALEQRLNEVIKTRQQ